MAALAATATLFGSFAVVGQSSPVARGGEAAAGNTPMATAAAPPGVTGLRAPGYLTTPAPEDSIVLAPHPPQTGSPAEERDLAAAAVAIAMRGSARWDLATADAHLIGPSATAAFSCAAGVMIGTATTPALERLLRRAMTDLGRSTSVIKKAYQRPRPFMVNGQPTCTPQAEATLRKDGSYPSGHSAIGFGLGLILAELIPQRASQLVARGRAFGDSRRVCNVHWLSDIEEGRIAAAATVARLHAEPAFRADLDAARAELRSAKAKPGRCEQEQAALAG